MWLMLNRRKTGSWQKSALILLNSAFDSLSSRPRFIQHHPNQNYEANYNLNICAKILLNGVEWPLRAGLRAKILPRLLQIENSGLSKTLARDNQRLDIFLEIPSKQDIPLPKTVSPVSAHFWAVSNGSQMVDVVAVHCADLKLQFH